LTTLTAIQATIEFPICEKHLRLKTLETKNVIAPIQAVELEFIFKKQLKSLWHILGLIIKSTIWGILKLLTQPLKLALLPSAILIFILIMEKRDEWPQ
jgi:hypothetical protein